MCHSNVSVCPEVDILVNQGVPIHAGNPLTRGQDPLLFNQHRLKICLDPLVDKQLQRLDGQFEPHWIPHWSLTVPKWCIVTGKYLWFEGVKGCNIILENAFTRVLSDKCRLYADTYVLLLDANWSSRHSVKTVRFSRFGENKNRE